MLQPYSINDDDNKKFVPRVIGVEQDTGPDQVPRLGTSRTVHIKHRKATQFADALDSEHPACKPVI